MFVIRALTRTAQTNVALRVQSAAMLMCVIAFRAAKHLSMRKKWGKNVPWWLARAWDNKTVASCGLSVVN
jgi:hypothetical protein